MYTCTNCSNVYVRKDKYEQHLEKGDCSVTISLREALPTMIYTDSFNSAGAEDSDSFHGEGVEESEGRHNSYDESISVEDNEGFYPADIDDNISFYGGNNAGRNNSYGEFIGDCTSSDKDVSVPFLIDNVIDVSNVDTNGFDSPLSYKLEIADSTLKKLKQLRNAGKRSSVKRKEFGKLCLLLFDNKIDDQLFLNMISADMGFKDSNDFLNFINSESKRRGRSQFDKDLSQKIYKFWIMNSDLSNDRRNARHMINIKKSKIDPSLIDVVDANVIECGCKRGDRLKAQRKIYNENIRNLFKRFQYRYPDDKVSLSMFYRCKPFYITQANQQEMESCLCTKCLNPHTLYKVIRKHTEGLPYSLTEYLTSSFKCSVDAHLNYPKLDCINNKCRNQCEITDDSGTTFNWEKNLSYYLFGKKEETFYNKRGKKVTYTRTARIDYNDVPLRQVYDTLMNLAQRYLIHRYHVSTDRVYWEKFVSETDQYILWVDYSQNIALTPKFEVQSAHFQGGNIPCMIHCCMLHSRTL